MRSAFVRTVRGARRRVPEDGDGTDPKHATAGRQQGRPRSRAEAPTDAPSPRRPLLRPARAVPHKGAAATLVPLLACLCLCERGGFALTHAHGGTCIVAPRGLAGMLVGLYPILWCVLRCLTRILPRLYPHTPHGRQARMTSCLPQVPLTSLRAHARSWRRAAKLSARDISWEDTARVVCAGVGMLSRNHEGNRGSFILRKVMGHLEHKLASLSVPATAPGGGGGGGGGGEGERGRGGGR